MPKASCTETAYLAGGCFWGVEACLKGIRGVLETETGYMGGSLNNPSYEDVCSGTSGHAETVKVVFDPAILSFNHLLQHFFKMHDHTSKNRQGNDRGTQYRSAIFFTSSEQELCARALIEELSGSGTFSKPVVTEISPALTFWRAEEYHQDYLSKNPFGYCSHHYIPGDL
jgi:methionine-S-sulfoxide reductase